MSTLRLDGDGTGAVRAFTDLKAAIDKTEDSLELKRLGSGWRSSYIQKILRDRSVIGEYQPHTKKNGVRTPAGEPIVDYYPAIVDRPLFYTVQEILKKNRGKGGRTGKVSNLFTHLVRCAYCGGPMHFVDKGKLPKGRQYLVCDKAKRGRGCQMTSIRYDEVETLILNNCRRLNPEAVLPDPHQQSEVRSTLSASIVAASTEIAEFEDRIRNLTDQISRTKNAEVRDRMEATMGELIDAKGERQRALAETKSNLRDAEATGDSLTAWKDRLAELLHALAQPNPELRMAVRLHLRQFITRIDCYTRGHAQVCNDSQRDGEALAEHIDALRAEYGLPCDPKTYNAF